MTFYEAAIEVLLKAGRPLHFKKITEAALQENLLSHVGKTPEVTMSERLNQEVKRQENSPVVCVRPGVYMLREESIEELQKEARQRPTRELAPRPSESQMSKTAQANDSAAEVSASADAGSPQSETAGNGRRRRRSRGGRERGDRDRSGTQATSAVVSSAAQVSEAPTVVSEQVVAQAPAAVPVATPAAAAVAVPTPAAAPAPEAREPRESGGSGRRRGSRHGRESGRESGREADVVDAAVEQKHLSQGPVRLDGIAEAAVTVLQDGKAALDVKELAEEIFKRKLVRFHTHDAATTVQAALANDNHMRSLRGHRALFVQYDRQRWGLSEWGFSKVSVRKEQQILSLAEEIRQDALLHLGEALLSTKAEALEHLALTLLERKGYRNIKVSKRSAEGDVFFTGDWHHGLSEIRVCIEVVSDNQRELGSDAVTELRSTLHHYSASEGVIIHLGSISPAAIKESREERLAPITLIDRTAFVDMLSREGIGVKTYQVPVTLVDMAFIDDLSE